MHQKSFHLFVICKVYKILDHLMKYPINLVDIFNLIHYLFNVPHFHVLYLWQSMTVETICAIIFTQFQINYRHDFWRSFLMQQWFEICNNKELNKKCLSINFLINLIRCIQNIWYLHMMIGIYKNKILLTRAKLGWYLIL